MNKKFLIFFFLATNTSVVAQIPSPFQLLTPNPDEGENIQIYYNACDAPAPNYFTGEYYYVQQDNDVISVVVFTAPGLPTCPFFYEYYYDVGGFPIGNYQIDVYVTSSGTPYPIDLTGRTPVDSYVVSVAGSALPVPTLGFWNLLLMVLLFGLVALLSLRKEVKP